MATAVTQGPTPSLALRAELDEPREGEAGARGTLDASAPGVARFVQVYRGFLDGAAAGASR
ncbi:hypothetical protein D0T12_23090 [Actinomadura spongiicola]|uniref:Uncharacterized protein n=1 Tax=Actinomadura spongiicola TaxID=2303421 RepID=A0A372GD19_9ACTN|nr:hypothetical protein D0T12_23090 [Actinomadura spongiicola]